MADLTRRDVLRGMAVAGVAATGLSLDAESTPAGATMMGIPFERKSKVRLGIIGLGGRGGGVLHDWMGIPEIEVVAICDIVPDRLKEGQASIKATGRPAPAEYGKNETDYKRLCQRGDLDFIYIATPWDWHVPMAVDSMKGGAHCGVEVPAAVTLEDCWLLVDTSEQTRRHVMIMENCCYDFNELMLLNMCRQGVLGTLVHGEAAYLHDLRSLLLADYSEGLWRRKPHTTRNGNLYPTHGLGPVSNYMSVNRGDRYETLVSLSSKQAGLSEYRDRTLKPGDPKLKEKYICGDMNTSVLRTVGGLTVMLQHEVTMPRPYSRLNKIQGTHGLFEDYPSRIYIEGRTKEEDSWESLDGYKSEFQHELWSKKGDLARRMGGHGGMDFLMCFRVVQCFLDGTPPDLDCYDAATFSAPGPLSVASNARGGAPQKFPDFTRGHWKDRKGVKGI